jgi:hypothetical protein
MNTHINMLSTDKLNELFSLSAFIKQVKTDKADKTDSAQVSNSELKELSKDSTKFLKYADKLLDGLDTDALCNLVLAINYKKRIHVHTDSYNYKIADVLPFDFETSADGIYLFLDR